MYVKADIIHLGIVPRKQRHVVKAESSEGQYGKRPAAWFSILRPKHTRRQIAATRRSNKFCRVNKRILLKILSPRQNFVAATCRTKSNWYLCATCCSDKILINQASNVEAFTPGDLSLQPIAAMSACDLLLDCTHKAICCSNVLPRFVASCVPTFMH